MCVYLVLFEVMVVRGGGGAPSVLIMLAVVVVEDGGGAPSVLILTAARGRQLVVACLVCVCMQM